MPQGKPHRPTLQAWGPIPPMLSKPLMETLILHLRRRIVPHITLNSRSLPTYTGSLPLAYCL
jgi:hypothetical protein